MRFFFFPIRTGKGIPRRMKVGISKPAQFGSFGIVAT